MFVYIYCSMTLMTLMLITFLIKSKLWNFFSLRHILKLSHVNFKYTSTTLLPPLLSIANKIKLKSYHSTFNNASTLALHVLSISYLITSIYFTIFLFITFHFFFLRCDRSHFESRRKKLYIIYIKRGIDLLFFRLKFSDYLTMWNCTYI